LECLGKFRPNPDAYRPLWLGFLVQQENLIMARPEIPPGAAQANEHASVPESIPAHNLPQAALDHMNAYFPPQHPEQPAEHHGPSDTGLDHMADAARDQLHVHPSDWFVV
jgi:hypothetical protein